MGKLLRPHIPLEVRCRVVLRQVGEMWPDDAVRWHGAKRGGLGRLLASRLDVLATLLRCDVKRLRLDHDPPLGARRKVFNADGEHVGYDPPANSVEHLRYRPQDTAAAGSHDVKTRIRGDHGQHSDIALVKRNRRQEEREGTRPKSWKTRAKEKRAADKAARKTRAVPTVPPRRPSSVNRNAPFANQKGRSVKPTSDLRPKLRGPKRKWPKRTFPKRRKP